MKGSRYSANNLDGYPEVRAQLRRLERARWRIDPPTWSNGRLLQVRARLTWSIYDGEKVIYTPGTSGPSAVGRRVVDRNIIERQQEGELPDVVTWALALPLPAEHRRPGKWLGRPKPAPDTEIPE